MFNIIKLMWDILKDERGIDPMTAGALVLGGSSLLGGLFGKSKKKEEVYDPYAKLRGQYQDYAGQQLGRQTPYQYNPAFETQQPAVETAAEKTILGQLESPKSHLPILKILLVNIMRPGQPEWASDTKQNRKNYRICIIV